MDAHVSTQISAVGVSGTGDVDADFVLESVAVVVAAAAAASEEYIAEANDSGLNVAVASAETDDPDAVGFVYLVAVVFAVDSIVFPPTSVGHIFALFFAPILRNQTETYL